MERGTTVMSTTCAVPAVAATALVLDRTDIVSLNLRGAIDDVGLRAVSRRSLDQLDGFLLHGSYSMVVMAVDEIDDAEIETIEQIRSLTDRPLMIVSGSEDLGMRAAAFDAGADEHVASTAPRRAIAARINAKLRRLAPRRDARSLRSS